jgi:hypothetical protein
MWRLLERIVLLNDIFVGNCFCLLLIQKMECWTCVVHITKGPEFITNCYDHSHMWCQWICILLHWSSLLFIICWIVVIIYCSCNWFCSCDEMYPDVFPRVSTSRGSAAQSVDGNLKSAGPRFRSRVSPCTGCDPGGSSPTEGHDASNSCYATSISVTTCELKYDVNFITSA